MRGKGKIFRINSVATRITPAGAGKRGHRKGVKNGKKDHPRRCGEKLLNYPKEYVELGSPPQVRGKDVQNVRREGDYRITPAGAGKRTSTWTKTPMSGDHPRRCGEKPLRIRLVFPLLGSPPQVRGKGCSSSGLILLKGITPAGAGKRHIRKNFISDIWDHPRRCGEKSLIAVV